METTDEMTNVDASGGASGDMEMVIVEAEDDIGGSEKAA